MTEMNDTWPAGATATMNVLYTQANAAGGAVVCEISPGAGNEFEVLEVTALNSGTNGIAVFKETITGGVQMTKYGSIGSGAGTSIFLVEGAIVNTSPTTSATASGLGIHTIISGVNALRISQTAAGAQNDTFQVLVTVRCKGAMPTVIHSNSTNPANVSVTGGVESFTAV